LLNNEHTSIGDQGAKTCLRLRHMNSFLWPSLMLHLGQGGVLLFRPLPLAFCSLCSRFDLTFKHSLFYNFLGGHVALLGPVPCKGRTYSVELTNKLVYILVGYPVQAETLFFKIYFMDILFLF
jgi:hypothetical protein